MNNERLRKICLAYNYSVINQNHGRCLRLNEILYKLLYMEYISEPDETRKESLKKDLNDLEEVAESLIWDSQIKSKEEQ